jgi:hypothetical protein
VFSMQRDEGPSRIQVGMSPSSDEQLTNHHHDWSYHVARLLVLTGRSVFMRTLGSALVGPFKPAGTILAIRIHVFVRVYLVISICPVKPLQ